MTSNRRTRPPLRCLACSCARAARHAQRGMRTRPLACARELCRCPVREMACPDPFDGAASAIRSAAHDESCSSGVLHLADSSCRAFQRQVAMGGHLPIVGAEAQTALNVHMLPVGMGELTGFVTTIVVFVRDRRGILLDVSMAVTRGCLNIIDVHSETLVPGQEAAFQFTVQISDASMLQTLTYGVEKVAGAVKVRAPAMCTVPLTEVQGPDLTFRMCEIFLPAVSHAVPSRYPITPIDA
mmetsp:Transcript_17044/g.47566  ORF Transcript_17044/g.47566 Transcript_17044/m.47566 type:complete len:240 (-) Transcript_17044:1883-2602(-)